MAFQHGDLHEVALGVGHGVAVDDERLALQRLRDDLIADEPDRASCAALPWDREVGGRDRLHPDRLAHPVGHVPERRVLERATALQHRVGHESLQVGKQEEVGDVSGGEGAMPVEPMPDGGMERGHQERVRRLDPGGDGVSHHPVDVPPVDDVLGVPVVGAERDPAGTVLLDEREERRQVSRHGRLAHQEPHACPKPLPPFLDGEHLVVRPDPRGRVRLQLLPEDAGRVTVHVGRTVQRELVELGRVAGDDAREVHHLGEPDHPPPAHQRLEIPEPEGPSRGFELRGGHARRGGEEDLELEPGRGVEQPVDSVGAEHVGDLVRVGDHGSRPQGKDETCEFVHEKLHRLEVHVGVDEARHDVPALRVDRLPAVVRGAHARDHPVHDRDVGIEPFTREDREHPPAAHHEIRGLVATGDGETAREPGHPETLTT